MRQIPKDIRTSVPLPYLPERICDVLHAADIAPLSGDLGQFKALAKRMFGIPGWEVKEYPTFLHVAVPRSEEARKWNGSPVPL